MSTHDAARIKIQFPDMDYDGDGAVDTSSAFYPCIFSGPDWSGFQKPSVDTTCSNATLDGWGNLIKTARAGTIIDFGTITLGIDWAVDTAEGGKAYGAFASRITGSFVVQIPANVGETTGPTLTFPGVVEQFTPQGQILGEGDEARFAAQVVIKLAGALTVAEAT